MQDVYSLDLAKTDLVVLSACETQLGARSAGADVVGLGRAFLYARASSVVASLWKVDDEATGVFMTAFYRELKAGKGKAEALRAAQAETRATYPNPYFWAAFVLAGDPGPGADAPASGSDSASGGPIIRAAGAAVLALLAGAAAFLLLRRRRESQGRAPEPQPDI